MWGTPSEICNDRIYYACNVLNQLKHAPLGYVIFIRKDVRSCIVYSRGAVLQALGQFSYNGYVPIYV